MDPAPASGLPAGSHRLFCLPYAGGGTAAFRPLKLSMPPTVKVDPVALPGRDARVYESPEFDVGAVTDAVLGRVDGPYALYGHSMGARLGFEVAREIVRRGGPLPRRLYVAGARPPDSPDPLGAIADLPDTEFLAMVGDLGGTPAGVTEHPELRELVLRVLRADFRWINRYRYQAGPPLPVPIVAFTGREDGTLPSGEVPGWGRHTAEGFRLHHVDGGHFFLTTAAPALAALIAADLVADEPVPAVTPTPVPLGSPAPGSVPGLEPAAPPAGLPAHLVAMPGTGWTLWRHAVIRSTGFPVDGLARFSADAAATVTDDYLAGVASEADFDRAFAEAVAAGATDARDIARDALFREAVTWQNRTALHSVDAVAAGLDPARRNARNRDREIAVLRYWQRYCTKNETVGFFGPICRVRLDPDVEAVEVRPGPGLVRNRQVILEHWALQAYADACAEDPAVRRWMPVRMHPHHALGDRALLRPAHDPLPLQPAELAALSAAGRGAPAQEVADRLVADPALPQRKAEDVFLLLDRLVERDLLVWGADLPVNDATERVLRERLAGIPDGAARAGALAGLDRLSAARDEVAAAAGDPDRLRRALDRLDAVFEELTGRGPQRNAGQMYAGRTLCVEDTARDLEVTIGRRVVDALAAPLATLLHAARWVTAEVTRGYLDAFDKLFDELAGGGTQVPLAELWYLGLGLFFGAGPKPSDRVTAEFTARWTALLGLAPGDRWDAAGDGKEIRLSCAELMRRLPETFPADRPGWRAARIHSPDIILCAAGVDALRRGDFFAVLGEMHAGWQTLDSGVMLDVAGPFDDLVTAMAADTGPSRIIPLYHVGWPRLGRRTSLRLDGPDDRQLGYEVAPGVDPRRLLPLSSLTVVREGDHLRAVAPDGASWPLMEVFAGIASIYTLDSFKLVAPAAYTPRVVLDRMVVARQTWRTTVGETGLAGVTGERELYLAARRWRRGLGLPDRVFVKLGTEVKPFYVDLTSPQHVGSLRRFLRAAEHDGGPEAAVAITELLPGPEHAWLPDAEGRRYFCELRLHARDPRTADE